MADVSGDREGPALLERDGAIATITLNRPEAYNALNDAMAERLRDFAIEVAGDASVRAVVVRGAGPTFSAGGDIRHFADNLDRIGPGIRDILIPYHAFIEQLRHMPKPVIASVHGSAAGAGFSLVTVCDFCVAADDARFAPAYARLGVSPDGGGTYGLVRAVGERRAMQIFLGQDSFSAAEGVAWGLIGSAVPAPELAGATRALAERLAAINPPAFEATKRLVRRAATAELHDHLIDEMDSLIACMGTEPFRAAVARFLKK